ncbi:MAG: hypothetical protein WAZ30_00385 [Syntrophorhabdus sp.]|jgi:hypothetical protein
MTFKKISFDPKVDLPSIISWGFSDTANILKKLNDELCDRLRLSLSLGYQPVEIYNDLFGVAEECSTEGWDGGTAKPVTKAVFDQGFHFLRSLPLGIATPSVAADPDGDITFEWYRSASRVLTISIDPSGLMHYAAIIGIRKAYGTESLAAGIPSFLIELVRQVAD